MITYIKTGVTATEISEQYNHYRSTGYGHRDAAATRWYDIQRNKTRRPGPDPVAKTGEKK